MPDAVVGSDVIAETGVGILVVGAERTGGVVIEGTSVMPNATGDAEAGAEKAGDDVDGAIAVISPFTGATEGGAAEDEAGSLVARAVTVVG
jgi:hypothetical protein